MARKKKIVADPEKLRYALKEYDEYRGWPGSLGAEMVAADLATAARLFLEELDGNKAPADSLGEGDE